MPYTRYILVLSESSGVRMPRELDNRLLGLVCQLRMQGVRVSKAEIVAMALQELPEDATPAFVRKMERR